MSNTEGLVLRPVYWRNPETPTYPSEAALLPLMRAALTAAPNRSDLKLQLATALFHTDKLAEIVEWFRSDVADKDANPKLLYYLGGGAWAADDDQLAVNAFRLAAAKGCTEAFGHLAEALCHLCRKEEALEAAVKGLEYSPSEFRALGVVARVLLERGEAERLWNLCRALQTRGAWGGYVPSAKAFAATTLEQESEVAALVDPQQWFSSTRLAVPEDFNRRLEAELLAHASLSPLPSTKATVGAGRRIGQLQSVGGTVAQDLLIKIRGAVELYIAERQRLTDHPMVAHRPTSITLSSWALAVNGDGHERWHIHPDGWISGVYYVQVPQIRANGGAHPGAIEFGPYPFASQRKSSSWRNWHITPETGMLLLFPSFYGHRTWPTHVSDSRICVAFDVLPAFD